MRVVLCNHLKATLLLLEGELGRKGLSCFARARDQVIAELGEGSLHWSCRGLSARDRDRSSHEDRKFRSDISKKALLIAHLSLQEARFFCCWQVYRWRQKPVKTKSRREAVLSTTNVVMTGES